MGDLIKLPSSVKITLSAVHGCADFEGNRYGWLFNTKEGTIQTWCLSNGQVVKGDVPERVTDALVNIARRIGRASDE